MENNITRELVRSVLYICIAVSSENPIVLPPELIAEHIKWLNIKSKETGLAVKQCHRCGNYYLPDVRTEGHQKYCYFGCIQWMKKINSRKRNRKYRKSRRHKYAKSRQNQRYRSRRCEKKPSPCSRRSPKHRESITGITHKVVEVISRLFPRLSMEAVKWIHRVTQEEINANPFFRKSL